VPLAAFLVWEHRTPKPMVPLRLFASREFAIGNLTSYLMSGATFAAAFSLTQEFQLARSCSPLGTGLRLLPFFTTPMIVSPLAGALSDRAGRGRIMVTGLALQGRRLRMGRGARVAGDDLDRARCGAADRPHRHLDGPPHRAGSGPESGRPEEMGKASGINYMAQPAGPCSRSRSPAPCSRPTATWAVRPA
jgi:hypothetical protein